VNSLENNNQFKPSYASYFLNNDPLKIKCIGFSVTGYGDPCYPDVLGKQFKDANFLANVSYSSIGGLSIDALPSLLTSIVNKGDVDLVILEIATSWFSFVRTRKEESDEYINLIVNYLESINVKIIFLNLYRKDTDDNDLVVQSIKDAAFTKYPILDFKAEYRRQFTETGDDGTTDGVHPTNVTIEKFSANITKYIIENFNQMKSFVSNLERPEFFKIINLDLPQEKQTQFDNRHGLVLNTILLRKGESIEHCFSTPTLITGIFYLFGPDTNQINLTLNDELINVPMRDEMSYYRRIGYRYLGARSVNKLTMTHPDDLLNVEFSREPWEKIDGYQNYIIGFSTGI
jgi:hypothetical protein